jgi:hypothetical protein
LKSNNFEDVINNFQRDNIINIEINNIFRKNGIALNKAATILSEHIIKLALKKVCR